MKKSQPVEPRRTVKPKVWQKLQAEDMSLEIVHPDAAGIDIGNEAHYVAVPPTRDSPAVWRFGCVTAELQSMAEWLKQCGIRTVAMQSTGMYWIPVYDLLEQAGLEVFLVHAARPKICPARRPMCRRANG